LASVKQPAFIATATDESTQQDSSIRGV